MTPDPFQTGLSNTRRQFLGRMTSGIGIAALASLLNPPVRVAASPAIRSAGPHFAPKARRVIYLAQAGAPSQVDLFDYKPGLKQRFKQDLPASIRGSQRLTGMTSGQKTFPIAPSTFAFHQHGQSGMWLSELLPHIGRVSNEICLIRSLHTEAINHDPAMTFLQTGHPQAGRPSLGGWLSYGLGSDNSNLPAFVVMISRPSGPTNAQPLHERMWGAGFLPSQHQGVRFSPGKDPVLFLSNPPGINPERRRMILDDLGDLNRRKFDDYQDPEIQTRISQYELAYRMQASVPELADLSKESKSTLDLYGPDASTPGTFAANCLLARRLAERGVRFIQLYHRGWDQHADLPAGIRHQARDVDQPSAALIQDLKQRGMLEDTLVVWAGEFGRTVFSQGELTETNFGRDHHPRCFSIWMAGGGIRGGMTFGETDEFSYNIAADPVHLHDLNTTILHCLGLNHERLTFRHQGRDYRLTDIHGSLVRPILA
ncbi:MAG: DUF1501 domain-containing protein [Verrucomicrobia bacterium]|nr:DUF1501 domain-containing protein [Verrucomicrobiota bacterium]